jgi:hypothetical protein
MNGRSLRWFAMMAVLSITACGGGGDSAEVAADSTQPASGSQLPQAQPQTEVRRDTPVGTATAAPPAPGSASGRTYADCAAEAKGSAEERAILLRACESLPGAPR